MGEINILERIRNLMDEKNMSENALSKKCDLPQSTINSLFVKNNVPTLPTLIKICQGLGVTVTQLLLEDGDDTVVLNSNQLELIKYWNSLSEANQNVLMDTARSLKRNQK